MDAVSVSLVAQGIFVQGELTKAQYRFDDAEFRLDGLPCAGHRGLGQL